MKNLTLIVPTNSQQELSDQLRAMEQVPGFTFSSAEGHGVQVENDPLLSARDKVVGYTPRVRVDILLQDSDVDAVLDLLRSKMLSLRGQSIYWLTQVEKSGHF